MEKKHFTVPSADGRTTLHGIRWIPDGEIHGVLQLVHGMSEYIDRYDALASYLCGYGIAVIGHDHLGHGGSIVSMDDLGYFAESDGKVILLKDMYRITWLAKKLWPDQPVFLLGHSFGSFLLRRYITIYGSEIAGAVICGTGDFALGEVRFAHRLAGTIRRQMGSHYVSPLLDQLAMGSIRVQFGPGPGRKDGSWLSANEENAARYEADPLCGFPFTAGAYEDFFSLLCDLAEKKDGEHIPKKLPILMISGMDDALGGYTKKVLQVYNRMIATGLKDVDIYFYADDRHEILQEDDCEKVFGDIRDWMEKRMG